MISSVRVLLGFSAHRFTCEWQGVGTRIDFVVPVTVCDAHVTAASLLAQHPGFNQPLRILCVDDVPEMLYVLKLYLRDTPHIVEFAHTAAQALRLFRARVDSQPFDVVILDRVRLLLVITGIMFCVCFFFNLGTPSFV